MNFGEQDILDVTVSLAASRSNPYYRTFCYLAQAMVKSVEFGIGSVKLTISFDTVEELKTALGQVDEIKQVLKEIVPEASTEAPKIVRKELQPFFDYEGGKLVMSRPPPTDI